MQIFDKFVGRQVVQQDEVRHTDFWLTRHRSKALLTHCGRNYAVHIQYGFVLSTNRYTKQRETQPPTTSISWKLSNISNVYVGSTAKCSVTSKKKMHFRYKTQTDRTDHPTNQPTNQIKELIFFL